MRTGYKYSRSKCQICGDMIAHNWWNRHRRKCTPVKIKDALKYQPIAGTRKQATAKVRVLAMKLAGIIRPSLITRFYETEPFLHFMSDYSGNTWVEGSWGLAIVTDNIFTEHTLYEMRGISNEISIDEIGIHPVDKTRTKWVFCLSARMPDQEGET